MLGAGPKLLSASITPKPKKVFALPTFKIDVSPSQKAETARAVFRITEDIKLGRALSEDVYRTGRHHTPDNLLATTGIMHLHPLGRGTSELLFLVQYETVVFFLEVSDHRHFAILPPGHLLLALHGDAIMAQEEEVKRRQQQRALAWAEAERASGKPPS